jgi:hypothetical protein
MERCRLHPDVHRHGRRDPRRRPAAENRDLQSNHREQRRLRKERGLPRRPFRTRRCANGSFFNDEDKASLHASAGLTRHFKPKPAFHAVRHLRETLGDFRFRRTVTDEPGKLRVQEYRDDGKPARLIWAVWSPTGEPGMRKTVRTGVPGRLVSASRMPLTETAPAPNTAREIQAGTVELEVGGSPVYLMLNQ